jgi:predicted nucleic acid-binding protein
MILADTSIWIGHFRKTLPALVRALDRREILIHPFVLSEIALGSMKQRGMVLRDLRALPAATVATSDEISAFIEAEKLYGRGIGYVDVGLLVSTRLTPGAKLWTRDTRLAAVASALSIGTDDEGMPN